MDGLVGLNDVITCFCEISAAQCFRMFVFFGPGGNYLILINYLRITLTYSYQLQSIGWSRAPTWRLIYHPSISEVEHWGRILRECP
jgi:hypothetical protein